MMTKLDGYMQTSSLDINIEYYHIKLSPGSKNICTSIITWGNYKYQKLPMGICNMSDIF